MTLQGGTQTCAECASGHSTASNCTGTYPTVSPSAAPSDQPSKEPTRAPTPTAAFIGLPYLYTATYGGAIGDLGDRANTSAYCLANHPDLYECSRAVALVCYSTSPVWSLPTAFNFSASDNIWLPTPQYAWDAENLGNFSTLLSGSKWVVAAATD